MWITPNQLYDTVDQIKEYVDNNSGGSVDPELESKVESNTANISVLQSAVNAQGTTITNQQTQITQNVAAIESLETEVEDQKTLLEGATTTIGQLGTEVNDLSGSVASVEADTTSLSNAVGQLSTSLGETNTTIQGISEDVTTIQNDVNALTATTSNLETLVNQLVARGALEQTALWTGTVSEIGSNQSIAGNVADYDYFYIEGEWNIADVSDVPTGTEAIISQFVKIESSYTTIRVPISYSALSTSPSASWYNKEIVIDLDLTQNTFNIVSNNTNETNKNTITKLIGWKLGGSGGTSNNSVNYSTDEKEIGTWIDGSKLYQRTIEADIPVGSTDPRVITIDANINNEPIYYPHIVEGFIQFKPNSSSIVDGSVYALNSPPLTTAAGNPYITYTNINKQAGEGIFKISIRLAPTLLTDSIGKAYIVLNYTKNTPPVQ